MPLVEISSGVVFFLSFWRFGLSAEFVITAVYSCLFLVIIFIDWEHQLILNRVTYPAAVVVLIVLSIDSLLPEPGILSNLDFVPELSVLSGIIGGAIGFIFFLIVLLISPKGMGMGDIKLAGLIGLITGFPLVIVALLIGIFIGGIVAIILLAFRIKGRKDAIPYGTFLALGPIAVLLWGKEIFNWYLGLF